MSASDKEKLLRFHRSKAEERRRRVLEEDARRRREEEEERDRRREEFKRKRKAEKVGRKKTKSAQSCTVYRAVNCQHPLLENI